MKSKGKHFSLVQKDMAIDGHVAVKGEIVIGGTMKGTLTAGRVIVSEGGNVAAKVRAHSITISGVVSGEIAAREVTLSPTGVCKGEVKCADLIIEPGGQLSASVIHTPEGRSAASAKAGRHSEAQEKEAVTGK